MRQPRPRWLAERPGWSEGICGASHSSAVTVSGSSRAMPRAVSSAVAPVRGGAGERGVDEPVAASRPPRERASAGQGVGRGDGLGDLPSSCPRRSGSTVAALAGTNSNRVRAKILITAETAVTLTFEAAGEGGQRRGEDAEADRDDEADRDQHPHLAWQPRDARRPRSSSSASARSSPSVAAMASSTETLYPSMLLDPWIARAALTAAASSVLLRVGSQARRPRREI